MKKGIFQNLITAMLMTVPVLSSGAELKAINFKQVGEISQLELLLDENDVKANRFPIPEDKQIIIDIENTSATERVMRAFDTSEFSGSVVFVSAYKKPGSTNDLRIAVQLRDNVRSVLKKIQNRIILDVENRFGVFSQSDVSANQTYEEKKREQEEVVSDRINVPKSEAIEDILENLTMSGKKKYIGKKITLNVKDVLVSDLLKMIAEASGFNIILTEEVGKLDPLTLNLVNIPWDQALDTILGLNNLVAKKNGIILMIQTLAKATEERKREAAAKALAVKQEPLVTKVFPISYADIKELSDILKQYTTEERGNIAQDKRTNSLIIKDTPDVIEKVRKIIEVLDTQTPQVLIEAKITEVSETFSKEIGLREGLGFGYDPVGAITSRTPTEVGEDVSSSRDGGPGFTFSSASIGGSDGATLFGLAVTRFGRLTNLNFTLQLMETEAKGKVLSSPKVITQNKQKATLSSSKSQVYQIQEGTGDNATFTFQESEATLELAVTPQITNEGSIVLEIEVKKQDFGEIPIPGGPPNKTGNNVKTNVLVDNGSTIVLGGLYEYKKKEEHSGVPYLKDIPIIGWLFRTRYAPQTDKREVIIFMTPRIINQEEAGLTDQV